MHHYEKAFGVKFIKHKFKGLQSVKKEQREAHQPARRYDLYHRVVREAQKERRIEFFRIRGEAAAEHGAFVKYVKGVFPDVEPAAVGKLGA